MGLSPNGLKGRSGHGFPDDDELDGDELAFVSPSLSTRKRASPEQLGGVGTAAACRIGPVCSVSSGRAGELKRLRSALGPHSPSAPDDEVGGPLGERPGKPLVYMEPGELEGFCFEVCMQPRGERFLVKHLSREGDLLSYLRYSFPDPTKPYYGRAEVVLSTTVRTLELTPDNLFFLRRVSLFSEDHFRRLSSFNADFFYYRSPEHSSPSSLAMPHFSRISAKPSSPKSKPLVQRYSTLDKIKDLDSGNPLDRYFHRAPHLLPSSSNTPELLRASPQTSTTKPTTKSTTTRRSSTSSDSLLKRSPKPPTAEKAAHKRPVFISLLDGDESPQGEEQLSQDFSKSRSPKVNCGAPPGILSEDDSQSGDESYLSQPLRASPRTGSASPRSFSAQLLGSDDDEPTRLSSKPPSRTPLSPSSSSSSSSSSSMPSPPRTFQASSRMVLRFDQASQSSDNYEDDGFVVSDEHVEFNDGHVEETRDAVGELDPSLPVAFRTVDEQSAFGVFVQYLLSCILDPDFRPMLSASQDDNYFVPAIKVIERKLNTVTKGVMQSDLWKDPLLTDLDQLPLFRTVAEDVATVNAKCQACNRSHKNSGVRIMLSGVRYSTRKFRETLEYQSGDPDFDNQPTDAVYVIGHSCQKRTQHYHMLVHYRFNLFEGLKDLTNSFLQRYGTLDGDQMVRILFEDDVAWINDLYREFQYICTPFSEAQNERYISGMKRPDA